MPTLVSFGAVAAALALVGAHWGFDDPRAYAWFWILTGLVVASARRLSELMAPATRADAVLSAAVAALALIVGAAMLLGSLGQLRLWELLAVQAIACGAIRAAARPDAAAPIGDDPRVVRPWTAGMCGAIVACAAAYGIAHQSAALYDSLSYHLFFAARWVQEHAISIVPTPFSDPAQAYAPANGELYFAWLMLPFHGDLLARIGQLPFAIVGALTLYATARRIGAAPAHAVYPAAFFLLSRPILEQTLGANVDLICAALFLTSLYFGLLAADRGRRADFVLWGVSIGLYAGSKYLALVYLPALALIVLLVKAPRERLLWTLPGMAAFAWPWYARNWIVAGSPIYPAGLSVAGLTLARGAFNRTAMLNSVFHTTSPRLLPAIGAHALGPTLFVVWIPVVVLGGLAMLRGRDRRRALVLILPFVMVPLYWFGLPVNIDSRFLMPAVAPALIPFAFAFRRSRSWNAFVHAAYAAAMAWIVVGSGSELPGALPWFMHGWLSLAGLIKAGFVLWFVTCAVGMSLLWWLVSYRPRWTASAATLFLAASTTMLALGGERWCVPSRCDYIEATSPHIGMDLVYAWRWLADHAQRSTIAYTGINLPYPLTGRQLTNRVVYVNIDGDPRWRFHDYDRAIRSGRFRPAAPLLATASGELRPVPQSAAFSGAAARPRYERMQGQRDVWIDNLRRLQVDYVFISALSPYEIDNVWHTDRGFPIEDAWASADPSEFRLAYENPAVRVFAVETAEDAQ